MSARSPDRSASRAARTRALLGFALVALAALHIVPEPFPAAGGLELEGVVEVVEKQQPISSVAGAAVAYEPDGGVPNPAPRPTEIATREKRFLPRVTVVPARSPVAFPNSDPIFHNVFSVSPGNRFDLGRYREGETRSARLDKPGLVRVYCNVHQQMVAYVLVVETPYYTIADEQGRFRLEGLPAGRGTVVVWHERSGVQRIPIELPLAEPLRIRLDATLARDVPHLNKFGRPYGREEQDSGYR